MSGMTKPALLSAAATTFGVAALLAGPAVPTAHADASCTVNGQYLHLSHPEIPTHSVTVEAKGSILGPGAVVTTHGINPVYGDVSGNITGRTVTFTITWHDGKGQAQYQGTVGDDGIAHGNATGNVIPINLWNPGSWNSTDSLTCSTGEGQAGQKLTAKVVNDVDVYNITDGPGKHKIGMLQAPSVVSLAEPCSFDGFCHVVVPNMEGGNGFAWAPGLLEPGS